MTQLRNARARAALYQSLRGSFGAAGYGEVETPLLVPAPGMEPHITAFEVPFVPETEVGTARSLYLHTSPEYAMKRLLADGAGAIFQLCKVFRNGEVSRAHNPEFTMLELYRPNADYHAIMADLERALGAASVALNAVGAGAAFAKTPYERLTVRDAMERYAGIRLEQHGEDAASLRAAAEAKGIRVGGADTFDDVFFHVFLQQVEPKLGVERPTYLIEYPRSMAALARLKPGAPEVAERFELFVAGQELANGYSELTDPVEQRARLVDEQAFRRRKGRPVYALDERFLEAVGRMPPAGGVAVGLDRVLMLLVGAQQIDDVLLFPAREFV